MRPRLHTTPLKSKQHVTCAAVKEALHTWLGQAQPAEPTMRGRPPVLQGSEDSTPDRCMKRSPSSVMSTSSVLGTCWLSRFSMKSQSRTELKNCKNSGQTCLVIIKGNIKARELCSFCLSQPWLPVVRGRARSSVRKRPWRVSLTRDGRVLTLTVPSELSCFRGFSGSASRPSG